MKLVLSFFFCLAPTIGFTQGLSCRTNVKTNITEQHQCECRVAVHAYNKSDLENPDNFSNLDESFNGQQETAEVHVLVKGVKETKLCQQVCRSKFDEAGKNLCTKNPHFDSLRGTVAGIHCSHRDTGKCCYQVLSTKDAQSSCK